MFVALREIRAAKGRFALMSGVIALIAFLLVMLTALTDGLGRQNTSAVEGLDANLVVLAPTGGKASYADSTLNQRQIDRWNEVPGATTSTIGIGHTRLEHDDKAATTAAFTAAMPDDEIVLPSDSAEDLGVNVGDTVTLSGKELRVTRVEDTRWYSHSPVATVSPATFEAATHQKAATALLVNGDVAKDAADAANKDVDTVSMTPKSSVSALAGYSSEHGSLLLIQAFLYGISALVVLAFISVWTVQRTREVAVMRALGGSRRYVLRDALGQALILLLVGLGVGVLLGGLVLLGIRNVAPVLAGLTTFALPVVGILLLGLIGSYVATRRVSRVDPLLALGGN